MEIAVKKGGGEHMGMEIDTCLVLDTYMYLNCQRIDDGEILEDILSTLLTDPDYGGGGKYYPEYHILEQAVEADPSLGQLRIGNQSHIMGYDTGTNACTFTTPDGDTTYIAFRGTSDGEWLDNGIGMTQTSTIQQERAVEYFDQVVENNQFTESQNLILTGHSKGGNKVQFITMDSEHAGLIDTCYAVDGQGFSELAIEKWQSQYSSEEYQQRIDKIYGINGENDYISVLGHSIIRQDHISYMATEVKPGDFAGYHDIKYLFATVKENADGTSMMNWQGKMTGYVTKRGELGDYTATLSAQIMALPVEQRAGAAAVLMQMMELGGEKKTGLNGERISYKDVTEFVQYGIPSILGSLLFTKNGRDLLSNYLSGGRQYAVYQVKPLLLGVQSEELTKIGHRLENLSGEVEEIRIQMNHFMKGRWILNYRLSKEKGDVEKEAKKLLQFGNLLQQILCLYQEAEYKVLQC